MRFELQKTGKFTLLAVFDCNLKKKWQSVRDIVGMGAKVCAAKTWSRHFFFVEEKQKPSKTFYSYKTYFDLDHLCLNQRNIFTACEFSGTARKIIHMLAESINFEKVRLVSVCL